jgi:ribosome-dependent ATPase
MSMMYRGRVLALGPPAQLVEERKAKTLEEAFIGYLEDAAKEEAAASGTQQAGAEAAAPPEPPASHVDSRPGRFSFARVWAFARREAIELSHDTVRLAFAVIGPLLLMIVFGYGISLDVNHVSFGVLDFDGSLASRQYADMFRGSIYYDEKPPIFSYDELDRRLRNGELRFAVEVPSGFQADIERGRQPTIAAYIDAAVPFRGETVRGYVENSTNQYDAQIRAARGLAPRAQPVTVNPRALYNQSFSSIYAMVPGDVMLLLMLIPSMLTALSVVREKELGSIANFYAAPATRSEFLLGKQLPYVAVSLVQFVTLVALAVFLFQVPIKGSLLTLILGGVIYVLASTGFGLLISTFAATQTAAIFAAAIITILPASQFSGMFVPVSSLTGTAAIASKIFPSTYFQAISVGAFTKALNITTLWPNVVWLAVIAAVYFTLSVALLTKQEK